MLLSEIKDMYFEVEIATKCIVNSMCVTYKAAAIAVIKEKGANGDAHDKSKGPCYAFCGPLSCSVLFRFLCKLTVCTG